MQMTCLFNTLMQSFEEPARGEVGSCRPLVGRGALQAYEGWVVVS